MFFGKHVPSLSRTVTRVITLKYKMCLFLDEAYSWAEKLFTDVNLSPLMPDEDNFGGSLVLDYRKWWRHVQPSNKYILTVRKRKWAIKMAGP